jgi:hypothetical protein
MSTNEKIIVSAAPLLQDRLGKGHWLLVFTSERIIAIKIGSASDVVGSALVQGLAGPFAPESDADKEVKRISSLPVDDILNLENEKDIYPTEAIESIIIKPSRMAPSISIMERGKKRKVYRGPRKEILKVHEQKEKLKIYLPNIK